MKTSALEEVTLRPTGGLKYTIISFWALLGAGGLWVIYDAVLSHNGNLVQIGEGVAAFLFGSWLGLGLATTMYVASREYLEFRQFGIVWWKIGMPDIGVSQSENPYAISVVDTKRNKVRTELNLRLYKADDFQHFCEFIDESRERFGIDLVDPTEDSEEDASIGSFAKSLIRPMIFVTFSFACLLVWTAIRQHLRIGEIFIRAVEVGALIIALFGAIVLVYLVAVLIDRRKRNPD
jgi:hypothetical protein